MGSHQGLRGRKGGRAVTGASVGTTADRMRHVCSKLGRAGSQNDESRPGLASGAASTHGVRLNPQRAKKTSHETSGACQLFADRIKHGETRHVLPMFLQMFVFREGLCERRKGVGKMFRRKGSGRMGS